MSIKPGIRLGERYQLLAPIATGGMGQVWRAEDTTLHRVVAAKILRSEFTGDETFLERFRAEARNTASLSHPNIASVYDYGEQVHNTERLCYLVMELVEGKPLVDILARERRLSPDRTLDYLEQTAMGLAAAHRENMVHRDIKPGNLIIRPDGVLKITDFGIARAANSVALTERGTVVGTAQYLAPEQAEGKPAWPASDIYALGVVGYECLAGFRPFDGDNSVAIALAQIRETPRPLPADVPPHVRALIEMTMRKNPTARYQDGATFIPVVRAVRAGNMPPPPVIRGPQPGPGPQMPGAPAMGPGPGRAPGQVPNQVPGQAPNQVPGQAPGQAPGALPPGPAAPGQAAPGPPTPGPAAPGGPRAASGRPGPASAGPGAQIPGGPPPGRMPNQPTPTSLPGSPPPGGPGYPTGPGRTQVPGRPGPAAQSGTQARPAAPVDRPGSQNPQAPPAPQVPPNTQGPQNTQLPPNAQGPPNAQLPPNAQGPQAPGGTGTFRAGAPDGTGTYSAPPASRSGSYPSVPGRPGAAGAFPPGSTQPPNTASGPEADGRKVAWFWIGLGLLLVAAIIALAVVLVNESGDDELTGSPLPIIENTELKEDLR